MPQGTLANLATSAFVRTPPALAEHIVRCLLAFPVGKTTNVLDPTAGEGDLLVPCRNIPQARLYGVEISAERTAITRDRLPQAELVTCAFEGVSIPKGSMSLVLANPPYFFQDGKRAEYRILADAGTLLMPGGVMVAIIPARSAWDGTMINHWCRWYERVRVWKFPDRASQEEEGAFEDYTQICVVGIRRVEPRDPLPAESRRLQGYRYHAPSVSASGRSPSRVRAGWEQGTPQPAWVSNLRRAWLKNPRTLTLLGLTPVHEVGSGQVIAYRRKDGSLLPPEEAGPQALPVLVSTPKKVTKEYAAEVRAAWPESEVVFIDRHSDIPEWMQRCADSRAPAVIAILSHSLTRAFGREWRPVVREKQITRREPVMEPHRDLLPKLDPVYDEGHVLTGFRWKANGTLYTEETTVTHFFCPDCGAQIKATPGRLHEREQRPDEEEQSLTALTPGKQDNSTTDEEDDLEPVTSRTWFTLKPRWCRCRNDARNRPGPRNPLGKTRVRTPLWSEMRLEAAQRKHPQLPFAAWSAAVEHMARPGNVGQRSVAEAAVAYASPVRSTPAAGKCKAAVSSGLSLAASNSQGTQRHEETGYVAREPLPDSFSPYDYLYCFYRGCVALAVIDESHNGRGRDTDIAHAHHQAMLASQTRMLTSGTHYGGDILGFYHYWFRYHPQFWRRLGLGWNDADKALSRYGVIQEWTKEYESDARKGSGQTSVQVSTIPAPGLSAKLIPYLLEDMVYLTVLDVGAHLPPRIEIPEIVPMRDPQIADALTDAEQARREATWQLAEFAKEHAAGTDIHDAHVAAERDRLQRVLQEASEKEQTVQAWAEPRHLAAHYGRLVRALDDLARKRNTAARLAKGTVPRWFAVLPCERPFEVWETRRDRWGDIQGRSLLVETERLESEYLYPLERRLIALVQKELSERRRVMVYFEQNDLRSMARRLEWVLKEVHPWTLPNSVAAEDRQQAILQAVQRGHRIVIVPYRRVNEGLNLQSGIDTILWVEMALNLFMLDQASRRAWRLGKREEVRIYYLAYANTAGHTKLRKLGQQSGAAAAFAGEPARGALIEHAGADKTTLARLSSLLEQTENDDEEEDTQVLLTGESEVAEEEAALKAVFARRSEELRKALVRGREWLGGMQDDLAERFAALAASPADTSVWVACPHPLVPSIHRARKAVRVEAEQQRDDSQVEPVIPLPAVTTPVLTAAALSPALPAEMATTPPAVAPTAEPALMLLVGSRAEVVFGRNEHIALARARSRARRTREYGEPVRRRIPVSEREIPSLWDLLVAPTSGATKASPPLFAASSVVGRPLTSRTCGNEERRTRDAVEHTGAARLLKPLPDFEKKPHAPDHFSTSGLGHGGVLQRRRIR